MSSSSWFLHIHHIDTFGNRLCNRNKKLDTVPVSKVFCRNLAFFTMVRCCFAVSLRRNEAERVRVEMRLGTRSVERVWESWPRIFFFGDCFSGSIWEGLGELARSF